MLALLMLTLCACAPAPLRDGEREEGKGGYDMLENAGDPVRRVYIGTFIRDWQVIERGWVLMEFDRQRRFFIQLGPPCSSVIDEVTAIELLPGHSGYLGVFDQVRAGDMLCRIEGIRPMLTSTSRAQD